MAIFLSLLCATLWGFAELYYKKNTLDTKIVSVLVYKGVFQIIFFIVFIWIFDFEAFARFDINIYKYLLPMFIFSTIIGHTLYNLTIKKGTLSIVSPIMASDPVYIILIGLLLFKEKISIYALIALIVICFSVFALNFLNSKSKEKVKKIALLLASLYAFSTALATTFEKSIYLSEYKITDLYFHYIFLLLIFVIFCLISMKLRKQKLDKLNKNLFLGIAFNQSGYTLYSFLISKYYISLIAPLTGLYSVVTYILAIIVLKEKLSWKQNTCIFLIIISTIVLLIINS